MKKAFIFAAAALMMVACNSKKAEPIQTTLEEFNEWSQSYSIEVNNKLMEMDTTLTGEDKQVKMQEYSQQAYDAYVAHIKEVIKANKGNEVALAGIRAIYYELEPKECKEYIASLDSANAADPFIVSLSAALDAQDATAPGKMFTDFEVEQDPVSKPGVMTKFSEYVGNGKYVLVDFWASWCGPCKREIPNVKAVYDKYHGENFDVLSVAVWDDPKASVDTAAAYGVNWNHIINAQKIPTDIYGIQGIPHIILFGPDGTILERNLREEGIEEAVAKYVK